MSSRILWINPIGSSDFDQPIQEALDSGKHSDTKVDVISLERGPLHLNYHYYEALILTDTLHLIRKAEEKGYDGAVIGCFYDPGLREAREIVNNLMVIAPCESCLHIGASLGHSFSIIVSRDKCIPKMRENVVNYGFREHLASFKSINLEVHEFQKDQIETSERLKKAAKEAVEQNLAEVIILGCTAQFGFYKELQEDLGVPVIDASLGALKYAELLIELNKQFNWGHSKIYGYESPSEEEIINWGLEEQYSTRRGIYNLR